MCKCTPSIRTPFCGAVGCELPDKRVLRGLLRTNKSVWKYEIKVIGSPITLKMQKGFKIVHVATQDEILCIWVEVDETASIQLVNFYVIGTGWTIPKGFSHVGTVLHENFVWHVFQEDF